MAEKKSTDNPAKPFWSGMDYIKDTIGCLSILNGSGSFVVRNKSISLTTEEWDAIARSYDSLETAILYTWGEVTRIADDLEEMKWLHQEDAEAFRRACQVAAEEILKRLERFVNSDKLEV